jgi:hypothetical protein
VALHVRRGDIPVLLRNASEELLNGHISEVVTKYVAACVGYTAPLHFYDGPVAAAIKAGRKIVFFSDTPETLAYFQNKFGQADLVDGTKLARPARQPVQRAFIDFNLIIGADAVIGTGSSFAVFATELSGAPYHSVARKGPLSDFERYFFDEIYADITLPSSVRVLLREMVMERFGKGRALTEVQFT